MSTPKYSGDMSNYREIDDSDVESVGVGMYRISGKSKHGDFFDAGMSEWRCDVTVVMFARIDDDPECLWLPDGHIRSEIRPDGKRLIVGWTFLEGGGCVGGDRSDQVELHREMADESGEAERSAAVESSRGDT